MKQSTCDHCGLPVRLDYRVAVEAVRWTHDTGPVGRWTCPEPGSDGTRPMATVNGVEWFDPAPTEVAS